LVVRTFGEVDIASAKSLEKEIRSAFDSDAEAVLVDLSEVSFIDSTGLSVL
jgi:anti-anti-sigma factor